MLRCGLPAGSARASGGIASCGHRAAPWWRVPGGGAAAAGRPVRTTIQVPVVVGRTREEADAALAASGPLAWMGDVAAIGLRGTVEEAVEKVAGYRDRGVDGFIAQLPGTRRRPDFIAAYGELAAACRDL